MFTFQPVDLLVLLVAAVVILVGLSYLALRRRNELLQDFLTPDDKGLEVTFFKKRPEPEPVPEQESGQDENVDKEEVSASWGDIDDPANEHAGSRNQAAN